MSDSYADQINSLTGITIGASTEVSQTDITNYLKAGFRDVISMVAKHNPKDLHLFAETQDGSIDGTGYEITSGIVVNVFRADGTTASSLHSCGQINAALKYKATDVDSLFYRSKLNPAYYWDNDKVYVLPAPSGDANGVNKAQITYVKYATHDALLEHDDVTTEMPEVYYPMVAIYAAIKQLEAYMSFYVVTEEDIELAQGLQANIATLKAQYNDFFLNSQGQERAQR